ncbi:MAG TPA: Rieske 2Fe-2S domain-containing protein, partial [Thermoanaerobaculia bacterium]|nr:Rieske 2Fe-2S domain-containing protein [Thermoanaerobaculia bacterium]
MSPSTRREALALLAIAAAGCARPAPPPESGATRLPLAAFAGGRRLRVLHEGLPAEVTLGPDGPVARSLVCTHRGCEVRWQEEAERYRCPCHFGEYDADGRVVGGEPSRPLR